jgi:hypothetical protein
MSQSWPDILSVLGIGNICYPDLDGKQLYQKCLVQTCHGEKFHREITWGMNACIKEGKNDGKNDGKKTDDDGLEC